MDKRQNIKLAFIGAGKMATALATGIQKNLKHIRVSAYDVSKEAVKKFTEVTGFPSYTDAQTALEGADLFLLAVKPQYAETAINSVLSILQNKPVYSIVAGWQISKLSQLLKHERIIRVMPNTPALAGEGMTCFSPGNAATTEDIQLANDIFASVGQVCQLPEKLLDAVTGLSGSGPAYVMEFIMGLADGGVYSGLPRDIALKLAIQTVLGTAALCRENPSSIAVLRDAVISPAGTTARGVMVLEESAFKAAAAKAVIAAAERSEELGKL